MDISSTYKTLNEQVAKTLKYKDVSHPRLLVTFSAVPCSGKTTIAKPLAEKLHALYLRNDSLRKMIIDMQPELLDIKEINKIFYPYLPNLYESLLKFNNGLWVLDASVDAHYEGIYKLFGDKYGFDIFIVRLDVHSEVVRKRIISRGNQAHASVRKYLELMDLRREEHEIFNRKHRTDININDTGRLDVDKIYQAVLKKLSR